MVAQAGYRVGESGCRCGPPTMRTRRRANRTRPAVSRGRPAAATDRTAIAVIGTYESSCTSVALPTLAAAGLALVSPVNSDPTLTSARVADPHVLVRLAPPDATQGSAAAAEAKALDLHRMYVLAGVSARAQRMQKALRAAAPSHQLAIVGKARSPRSAGASGAARADARRREPTRSGSASA